jgi:hypothetical protein
MDKLLLLSLLLLCGLSTASLLAAIDPQLRYWIRVGLALAGLAGTFGWLYAAPGGI